MAPALPIGNMPNRLASLLFHLPNDVLHAVRTLGKSPRFALAAILTFALGIGATTSIFGVIDSVLLRPLPYPDPGRIVEVRGVNARRNITRGMLSATDFVDLRSESRSLLGFCVYSYWTFIQTGESEPARITGLRATADLFAVLGVRPALGRVFDEKDDRAGAPEVAVLSYASFRDRFGRDPGILGKRVLLNGSQFTIIGVMPEGFQFPDRDVELWTTLAPELPNNPRDARFLSGLARLRPGVTREAAQAELQSISQSLAERFPKSNAGWSVGLARLGEDDAAAARPALNLILWAVVGLALIAATNVTGLLLARAAGRLKEVAIRAALGAGSVRLASPFVAETLVLALAGGALGIGLAHWGIDLIVAFGPAGSVARLADARIDPRAIAFALGLSVLLGVLVGLAPARPVARIPAAEALAEGGRGSARRPQRFRQALTVSQIAIAFTLLVGGGLLLRSLSRILNTDPGFDPKNTVTMGVFLRGTRYAEIPPQRAFLDQVLSRLRKTPGVVSAATTSHLPLQGTGGNIARPAFQLEHEPVEAGSEPTAQYRAVSPGYFATLGIPLLQGRDLAPEDGPEAPHVLVVNRAFAKRYLASRNPLGARLRWTNIGFYREWHTIVGVVDNVRAFDLRADEVPVLYAPYSQRTFPWLRSVSFVMRTSHDPQAIVPVAKSHILAVDPDQPISDIARMDERIHRSVAERRFWAFLVAVFAGAALVLAAVGLYGLIAYAVTQRTREMGIRMALGATRRDILRLVLSQGWVLAAFGLLLGIPTALAAAKLVSRQLYGVTPSDPLTFTAVAAAMLATAAAASGIPALRAARGEPIAALRED